MSDQAKALAAQYVTVLSDWLTADQMHMVRQLNASPAYSDGACASHDFCDANMAMHEAFIAVVGHDPISDESGMSDVDLALWEKAWEIARNGALTARESAQ